MTLNLNKLRNSSKALDTGTISTHFETQLNSVSNGAGLT